MPSSRWRSSRTTPASRCSIARLARNRQSHDSARALELIERVADGLRNLGVSNSQIREMAKRREVVHDIRVTSPVDGVVLKRSVSSGLRFDRGFEFYRIADLNDVWILADVYREQLRSIRRGASARITTGEESHALSATVSPSAPSSTRRR